MATEKADFSRLTILLIDDNKFIRKLVGEILSVFGVGKVVEAESADAAMMRMGETQPDVIFCDWLMEGKDGLDVLRAVRGGRAPIDPKTPFVMLTGERRSDHVVTALAEGADSYIAKPVSAAILMSHLMKLIHADNEVSFID